MKTKTTKDSYEAAYYLMYGARVVKVAHKLLSTQQIKKKNFNQQYIITLENVPKWAIMGWNSGITYGPIHEFKKARIKLKKLII